MVVAAFQRTLLQLDHMMFAADQRLRIIDSIFHDHSPGLADTRTANAAAFCVQYALAEMVIQVCVGAGIGGGVGGGVGVGVGVGGPKRCCTPPRIGVQ